MQALSSVGMEPLTGASPPDSKSKKAAVDFEAILLTSLFDSLQRSFSFDPQDLAPGASDYRSMGTQALAHAVSEGGGIGIARLILCHLHPPKEDMDSELRIGRRG